MKLDVTLRREIEKYTRTDGSPSAKRILRRTLNSVAERLEERELSAERIRDKQTNNIMCVYGRAAVCICIAQRVKAEMFEEHHGAALSEWARLVLSAVKSDIGDAGEFSDARHYSRLDAETIRLVKVTTEREEE